jgi:hypothetical protein
MMFDRPDKPVPILHYLPRDQMARGRHNLAFFWGVASGELLSLFVYVIIVMDGPIFPFTMVYAPLALLWEIAYPVNWFLWLSLFVGGPVLLGAYGYSAMRWRNIFVGLTLSIFHITCFVITSWARGVFR